MRLLNRLFHQSKQSPKYAAPDPQFLGDFLTGQVFLNIRFNISEEQFGSFTADVPDDLRELVPLWSLFYLMWLMRAAVRLTHGEEFEAEMMRAAYGRMMNAPRELSICSITVTFANSMRHWFDFFDTEADPIAALKVVEETDFPAVEWKFAMCFLVRDSSSPYYFDVTKGRGDLDGAAADITSRMNGADPGSWPMRPSLGVLSPRAREEQITPRCASELPGDPESAT
jgi:hypothetical protein